MHSYQPLQCFHATFKWTCIAKHRLLPFVRAPRGRWSSAMAVRQAINQVPTCNVWVVNTSRSRRLSTAFLATAAAPTAAYVHLPFCKRKCFYCDFPVEAVGLNTSKQKTQDKMQAYVELVCSEIAATTPAATQPLKTVSFGGGTPSLVPPHLLQLILNTLKQQFVIAPTAEISIEADPGTFDLQKLLQYRAIGVTRLSMGVQSFQDHLLKACGRSHTLSEVHAAMDAVKAANFPSWSLDLISGLPGLTVSGWRHSLEQAIAAQPDHISVYDLQVEEGTPFARWYAGDNTTLPKEPEAVAMFELASHLLSEAGYEHYEISNYAKPGHRSRHNQVYWHCQPYYAFGLGAASYVQRRRFTRPWGMQEYEQWVKQYIQSAVGCPASGVAVESKEEQLLDLIMLSLRLSDGLDLQRIQREYGAGVVKALLQTIDGKMQQGLMQLVPGQSSSYISLGIGGGNTDSAAAPYDLLCSRLQSGQDCSVRLTDPAGFLLSNDIISDLFAQLHP